MDTLSCIVPIALLAAVIVGFAWRRVSAAAETLSLKDAPTNGAPMVPQRPLEER